MPVIAVTRGPKGWQMTLPDGRVVYPSSTKDALRIAHREVPGTSVRFEP
jgi:hypothetical protein